MMLCTPYRCAQERKNIRRQLLNWSGKALSLVGLEEVLVGLDAAHFGKTSQDKLPFSEVSSILSKAVSSIENDSNICGICGKPKKAPLRKIAYSHPLLSSTNDVIDLTMIAAAATQPLSSGDQPIDLSKSSRLYSSPSALANDLSASLLRTPNGISSPMKSSVASKRQRVGIDNLSVQRGILQMGSSLDPSIVNQLVNNWSKVQPQQHRSHSPTASPNNAYDSFSFDNPGPSNNAAVQSGGAAIRPHHNYNRTSAAATAGSLQRTGNNNNNNNAGNSTGAHFTGEPSDISGSTLSDQDAVNRFKQWRVASWVQEASRHQREGSALAIEDPVPEVYKDPLTSRVSNRTSNANNNPSNVASRSSPPPPLSNVLRNVPAADNGAAKSTLRKRVAPVPPQTQQPAKQRHSTPPPPPANQQQHQHKSSATALDASSKRTRTDQPQFQTSLSAANTTTTPSLANNTNASLNNLASVLSSLFTSTSNSAANTQAVASSLLPSGVSSTDLDALLTLTLQNWAGTSASAATPSASLLPTTNSSVPQNDPTTALLTAAYQQQMQQAALLQLQYASIFSNPLLYSNLLLGGTSTGATTTANNINLSSLTNALGSSSSSTNVDAMLAEALLAMLGSGSSTTTPVPAAGSLATTPAQHSSSNKNQPQQQHSSHSHRHGNSSTVNASTPHRPHATPSSSTPTPNKATTTNKLVVNAQHKHPVPEIKAAHNASSSEAVILNLDSKKAKLDVQRSKSSLQLPVTRTAEAISPTVGAKDISDSGEPAAVVEDLSIRSSSRQEVLQNGTRDLEEKEECDKLQNGDVKTEEVVLPTKALCSVVVNGEDDKELNEKIISHRLNNGKSLMADESCTSNQDNSRDSHSSAHLIEEEQSSRSPVRPASPSNKSPKIIDLQTTV